MSKIIIIVFLVASILGILFWKFGWPYLTGASQPKEVTLTYWGLYDDEAIVKPLLDDYHLSHPNVRVNYVKQSLTNYRSRLQTQLQAGTGPDLFWTNNAWLPMMIYDSAPLPSSVMSLGDFSKTFYPAAKASLANQNQIYGLPLEIDGLALYYNEDLLKGVNVSPPTSWTDFVNDAKKMTVPDQYGQIQTSGAAMGTATNVAHWSEIVAMLFMQQPSADLSKPDNSYGGDVLRFYTNFVTNPQDKTWDVTLPSSLQMFEQGRLAFYFGTAREATMIKQANPNLHFKVATVPVLPQSKQVSYADFWAVAVSNRSANQAAAWDFANYLTSPRAQQLLAQEKTQAGGFGQPYPRVDMAGLLASDPFLNPFVVQGPNYQSWYLNSDTQDAAINDEIVALYAKAVQSVLGGGNPQDSLHNISGDLTKTIDKYFHLGVTPVESNTIF
ncbi:MAG: extracellular solute-binding protein [Patescibacteria group bacterium]|nr:extracellular solute-binding protein [Patescibacteria group bacterium]